MKRMLMRGLFAVLLVGMTAGSSTFAAVTWDEANGTKTFKLDLDLASGGVTGTDHAFPQAVKTAWVSIPTGIPFSIYVEIDGDTTDGVFDGDSVHVGLETVPHMSLAAVNASSYYPRAMLLWTAGGPKFSIWGGGTGAASVGSRVGPQAHYFQNAPGDTSFQTVAAAVTALDTVGSVAASLKDWAYFDPVGGGARVQNMGLMRFSLCMGDNDSTADAAINFDCYIIFREDLPDKLHGALETPIDGVRGGTFRDPAEYSEFDADSFYGSHWVRYAEFDDKDFPVRSLR